VTSFDALLAEGESVPTEGWDFTWFAGRATEARPPWGYSRLLARRLAGTQGVLDLQTGGGEVLAEALTSAGHTPELLRATESWPPNLALASRALAPWGGEVMEVADAAPPPFPAATFDLVACRHPTVLHWAEVARVLAPGGRFLSQQVGNGSVRELTEAMTGPYDIGKGRLPERAVSHAEAAGLQVLDLQVASSPMTFEDIAAVVAFLRKVIWIVPGFTVEAYREPLRRLHRRILAEGPFKATSERFLIECAKPAC
jgi:SAM-dependent methyltransferase